MLQKQQPIYLNLLKISLPITGIASLLHRLTGLLLFIFLPILIYGLSLSLSGVSGFSRCLIFFESSYIRIILLLLIWALAHHFFAGLRFLLMDIDIGLSLPIARFTAWLVIIAGIAVMLFAVKGLLL